MFTESGKIFCGCRVLDRDRWQELQQKVQAGATLPVTDDGFTIDIC